LYGCQAGSSFQVDTFELCPKMFACPSHCVCYHAFMPITYITHAVIVSSMDLYVWLASSAPFVKVRIYWWCWWFCTKMSHMLHTCIHTCIQLLFSVERFVVNGLLNCIRSVCFSFKCFSFEFNDTVKFCIVVSDLSTWQEIILFRMCFVAWSKKLCIWSLENEKSTL
jgi:hypothetical protein